MLCKRIFISGGFAYDKESLKTTYYKSVEAIDNNSGVKFPSLPDKRADHCMVIDNDKRLMVCGGSVTPYRFKTDRECLILDGTWKFHSYLTRNRKGAIGITMPNGIYILGGWNSSETSDFLEKGSSTWIQGPKIPVVLKGFSQNCKYYRYGEAVSKEEFIIITMYIDRGNSTTRRVFSIKKFNVITQEWTRIEVKLGLGESCKNIFSSICPNSILRPTMDKFLPGLRGNKTIQIGVIIVKGVLKVMAIRDKNLATEWENANLIRKPIQEPKNGLTVTGVGFCSLLNTKLESMPSTLREHQDITIPALPKNNNVFRISVKSPIISARRY